MGSLGLPRAERLSVALQDGSVAEILVTYLGFIGERLLDYLDEAEGNDGNERRSN